MRPGSMEKMPAFDKILIIQTAAFGDHILTTALVETLKASFPHSSIDVLIRKGNESVFSNNPGVRKMLVLDKSQGKYRSLFRLGREVRAERYGLVVNLHRFFNLGLLTVLSGARTTVGFDRNPLSRFFTHREHYAFRKPDGSTMHEIERNHLLIQRWVNGPSLRPRLYPGESDMRSVEMYKSRPYVCIGVAASRYTNTLPRQQWLDLIHAIPAQVRVYLLGAAADIPLCDWLVNGARNGNVESVAGKFSLVQSAALMKDAVMNYSCDSSPLHMASAMNAPIAAIFLSTTTANGFGPLSDIRHIVETREKLDCRPCTTHGRSACPRGDLACATTIPAQQLLEPLIPIITSTEK